MISFEEALAILSEHAFPVGTINVPLQDALGCTLAEPVISPADLPYFDNSAVDGYGILSADSNTASPESPIPLELLATVPAGESSLKTVTSGTAVKILTGAPVPSGVEAVIMQEFTEQDNGTVFLKRSVKPGENIRYKGEELRQGDIVLSAGTAVNPAVIGLLASLGYTTIKVFRKPKVALIITGNELVPPGEALQPGQIYESNSYSLVAALATMGILEVTVSQVKDNREATEQVLQKALEDADVVITSGGVSVGEFDLVKDVFTACNIQPHFWQVAIKPGKPVFFGMYQAGELEREKLVFGLPGNPVAVMVTFLMLVKPALLKVLGRGMEPPLKFRARLGKDLKKKPGRLEFVRGVLSREGETLVVQPTVGQGSHMLSGMAKANALIHFPAHEAALVRNDWVETYYVNW